MSQNLANIVSGKRIIVCCGTGGVGKTTTAAALAVDIARSGKRTLVLTIDPAKRLAEALGIAENAKEPRPIQAASAAEIGLGSPALLHAWMLDVRQITDQIVRRSINSEGELLQLLANRVYQHISDMVAGLQEYMAMQALYSFDAQGSYDVIVVDTPPTRHAQDFLKGPENASKFLESRVFQLFLPGDGIIKRAGSAAMQAVLRLALGETFANEFSQFLEGFTRVMQHVGSDIAKMRKLLAAPTTCFLYVATPEARAGEEIFAFSTLAREEGLPLNALLLNQSHSQLLHRPSFTELSKQSGIQNVTALVSGVEKFKKLAEHEIRLARRDADIEQRLRRELQLPIFTLPMAPEGMTSPLPLLNFIAGELATAHSL